MEHKFLGRDKFREAVFERDGHSCVMCSAPAVDAHHIMDRKLFEDGGYYLNNGASVCEDCHLLAESTEITCDELRRNAGIKTILLPDQLSEDSSYDKWGNILLANGQRLKGEMFHQESVQKMLAKAGFLSLFSDRVKYPRTLHLPNSPTVHNDDKALGDYSQFEGKEVVVTIKMDGENSTLAAEYSHARSVNSKHHPSRNWLKNFHSGIKGDIPEGWRICGENLYAQHSIVYNNLKTYFYVFSIWDEKNNCLSWDDTLEWSSLMGLEPVPVIFRGKFDIEKIQEEFDKYEEESSDSVEGYVVRLTAGYPYHMFSKSIAKWVRPNHVQTDTHWMHSEVKPNGLVQ